MANNTITSPSGFMAAGVSCGIKQSGRADLGLLICPAGAKAAAVFTTNKIVAAPVVVSKKNVKSETVYAVVVNSGNANACTGENGIKDAEKMCIQTAELIGCEKENVLVASTGIIGERLPVSNVVFGIFEAAKILCDSATAGKDFARAILTTDTKEKQTIQKIEIDDKKITIAGCIKGSGMIGPNMATTLGFITTDVNISKAMLKKSLKTAVNNSINKLTVDIHQSTNDTAMILASGQAANRTIDAECPRYKKFAKALTTVCEDLSKQIMMDAEGATKIFKVVVKNAMTKKDAEKTARAVADYPLVKCAVHGSEPNWGRIIAAVGSVGVKLNVDKLCCQIGDIIVFKNGQPAEFDEKKVSKIISQKEHTITVALGAGKFEDFCIGCDLSKDYVKINADYHT